MKAKIQKKTKKDGLFVKKSFKKGYSRQKNP